jgi:hypothetical protein
MTRVRSKWDIPTRSRVRIMRDLGRPAYEIQRKTGVPKRTQRYIAQASTDRRTGKYRAGFQKKITNAQIDSWIQDLTGHYHIRSLDWRLLIRRWDIDVSPRTIARRFRERGLRKCRACQKPWLLKHHAEQRVEFSEEWKNTPLWKLKMIHFSDETHFLRNSKRTTWVLRLPSERDCSDCTQKSKKKQGWTTELHCWSMIAYDYKGPLVFFNKEENGGKNLTMETYVSKILPIVASRKEQLYRRGEGLIFQEDNDGAHGTRSYENSARYYKIDADIDYIEDWPPNSPDLSPIENIWRLLKQRLKARRTWNTVAELKETILLEWDLITLDEINQYIIGASKGRRRNWDWNTRLHECIERNGFMTRF